MSSAIGMDSGWAVTQRLRQWLRLRLLRLTTAVVLLWLTTLWWGERRVFANSAKQCDWHSWESWPSHAVPHRVLLIADPQLVDPHTYPGRPWPLSSLTFAYTDRYLKRANFYLHSRLQPDSTLFLGDLFDGGREWATAKSHSPEEQYRQYGQDFWLREYTRFSHIFLKNVLHGPLATAAAPMGRLIIASLPGNHDLGFARGIQIPVKNRFDAFFGPLNRVDVLGNHSIVSLDTASLSAMDQADPQTGSSGAGDGSASASANSHLWQPAEDFLTQAKTLRQQAVRRAAANMNLIAPQLLKQQPLRAGVFNLTDDIRLPRPSQPSVPSALFPTILLSHVPLFRPENTPCGPAREGNPSIRIAVGYQYQNVLTPFVSSDIIKHLSASEVIQIYSGDDHDYCEIEHSEFTGRIREITVKSISWAMGIRRPGVQLVSLWNPIDASKFSMANEDTPTPRDTLQNHLCLFPDQLGIFIRYAQTLALSLIVLAVAAGRYSPSAALSSTISLSDQFELLHPVSGYRQTRSTPTATSNSINNNNSYYRSARPITTTSTPLGGYCNIPPSSRSSSPSKPHTDPFAPAPGAHLIDQATNAYLPPTEKSRDYDDWGMPNRKFKRRRGRISPYDGSGPPGTKFRYFIRSLWEVAVPVLTFYIVLISLG